MKRLIGLILLAGLIYGGYVFYLQSRQAKSSNLHNQVQSFKNPAVIKISDSLSDYAKILGANISSVIDNGQTYLSEVTNGQSEPIVNELINKTTETLKDLPRKEAEKIKYEFCKSVVTDYESR